MESRLACGKLVMGSTLVCGKPVMGCTPACGDGECNGTCKSVMESGAWEIYTPVTVMVSKLGYGKQEMESTLGTCRQVMESIYRLVMESSILGTCTLGMESTPTWGRREMENSTGTCRRVMACKACTKVKGCSRSIHLRKQQPPSTPEGRRQ
ncbi:hypothetical protein Cgig2_017353 [Carnegiea gigantea]|uniref:Uncharacterized protein n=1 Tax=Carnegiea gigantea TaxID=171969 RepID=A0A9Q1K536_9CARY|nr:hypothetical protein Cgig2_017353 [Carnegiea gigantea]